VVFTLKSINGGPFSSLQRTEGILSTAQFFTI